MNKISTFRQVLKTCQPGLRHIHHIHQKKSPKKNNLDNNKQLTPPTTNNQHQHQQQNKQNKQPLKTPTKGERISDFTTKNAPFQFLRTGFFFFFLLPFFLWFFFFFFCFSTLFFPSPPFPLSPLLSQKLVLIYL